MDKEKELKKLEKKLKDLKEQNRSMWDQYGSELCVGAMINEEENIERKIKKLKES
jgi:hypothetical protein